MDNTVYATLNRQSGLMREMQAVANNIANAATTGFRGEGVIFAEHLADLDGREPSLAMAEAEARHVNLAQAPLTETGGDYDFAIEGEGFFMLRTADGDRLTRAGSFSPNAEGTLANPDGHALLDDGGSPVAIPPGAGSVSLAADGTLSADGEPIARVGIFRPGDPAGLRHQGGTVFDAGEGVEPVEDATIVQGFLEGSNVDPVGEIARMIEVQRAYEAGQAFLDREDERIRAVISTIGG